MPEIDPDRSVLVSALLGQVIVRTPERLRAKAAMYRSIVLMQRAFAMEHEDPPDSEERGFQKYMSEKANVYESIADLIEINAERNAAARLASE